MIVSPNLGLRIWNLPTDAFDSSQLADNFARIDEHRHVPGESGVAIPTEGIEDGAITTEKLAPNILLPTNTLLSHTPGCVLGTPSVTLTAGGTIPITWGSETLDTDGMHTNPSSTVTINTAGVYLLTGFAEVDLTASDYVRFTVGGGSLSGGAFGATRSERPANSDHALLSAVASGAFRVGDTINATLRVGNTSSTLVDASLGVHWIGPGA